MAEAIKLVLVTAVLLMVTSTSLCQDTGTERFPSFNTVRVRASRLNNQSEFVTHTEQPQGLFPNLTFSCSGEITRIWYIGKVVNGATVTISPNFQLWSSRVPSTVYQQIQPVTSLVDSTSLSSVIQLTSMQTNSFRYEDGYVFGTSYSSLMRRSDLLYLPSSRPTAYFGSTTTNLSTNTIQFSLSQLGIEINNDYPLIAVETDHPECVKGFLNISVLETLLANVISYSGQLRVIPQLRFPCGGLISGFIIGGKRSISTAESENLRVGLWRCATSSALNKVDCVRTRVISISSQQLVPMTGSPNVYEIKTQLTVDSAQTLALGIEQGAAANSDVTLYYQQDNGTNNYFAQYVSSQSGSDSVTLSNSMQMDQPLLYPKYSSITSGGGDQDVPSCMGNFIDLDTLKARALLIQPVLTNVLPVEPVMTTVPPTQSRGRRQVPGVTPGYQYFIPHLSFQNSGLLTSWVFASSRTTLTKPTIGTYPQFQIWTPEDPRGPINQVYTMMNATDPNVAPHAVPGELNVYEYNFDSQPLQYFRGDIVGIYQPPVELSHLKVAFVNDELSMVPAFRIPIQPNAEPAREYDFSVISQQSIGMISPILTVEAMPLTATAPPSPTSAPSETAPTSVTLITEEEKTTMSTEISTGTTPGITEETSMSITGNPGVTSPQGGLSDVAIAGVAVGGVVALLLLLVILLVVCMCVMSSRRKAGKVKLTTLENPEYSNVNNDAQMYEVPIKTTDLNVPQRSSAIYQTVGETPQPYEAPSITRRTGNNGDNAYHVLEPVGGSAGQQTNHIYHTVEGTKNNSTDSGRGADEISVVVPTGEQRKALNRTDERNLYASLTVVQSQTSSLKSDGSFFEESSAYWKPASSPEKIYQQLSSKKYREIPRNRIQVTDHLGSGHFGNVNKGLWQTASGSKPVAIKMLKSDPSDSDKVKFLQEAAVNGQFRHPNVVKLLGVVTIGEPVMIVLELMENGDLKSFLGKLRPAPGEMVPPDLPQVLLGFCQHIAAGMDYLSKKGFVHRDLAARNILVTGNKTCKVTDFGMSREIEEESYYVSKGGAIPVRWTAPEAINYKKFSTASDVWSYGCVMYEVWSLGRKPFSKHNNFEAVKLIEEGYRLPPPPGCPREIYTVMIQCWHSESNSRPTFALLLDLLLRPESKLLSWDEDKEVIKDNPRSAVLGSSLKFSKDLYPELQNMYKSAYD